MARVRACNSVNLKPGKIYNQYKRLITHTVDVAYRHKALLLRYERVFYFKYGSIILIRLWASIGVTRSYPSRLYHCKKLEVDLTQENVISIALWIHLGPGSGPPPVAMVKVYSPFPVKHSSKTWIRKFVCNCIKGVELCPYSWMNSENIHAL